MLIRKPGPVKAHSFRRLNAPCGGKWSEGSWTQGWGQMAVASPQVSPSGLMGPGWPALPYIPHSWSCHPGGGGGWGGLVEHRGWEEVGIC